MDATNALYNQWRDKTEAEELCNAPLPDEITRAVLLHAEPIPIGVASDKVVMAFRVLRYLGNFSTWELVPNAEAVRDVRAENLWLLEGDDLTKGLMPILGPDHVGPWPEVHELSYGPDPDTDEPFKRYGAWVKSSTGKIEVHWLTDPVQARKLHQACVDELEDQRQQTSAYRAMLERRRPWAEAYQRCCALLDDKVLAHFGQHLRPWKECVLAVLQDAVKSSQQWRSAEDFQAGARMVDEAGQELATALEGIKEARRSFIREHGLVTRLGELLQRNIQLCPLCFEPYKRDEAWLEQVLMEGETDLRCQCEDGVWRADMEDMPVRVAEFFRVRKEAPQFLTVLEPGNPLDPYEGRRVMLRHLEIGGVTVVRFVGLLTHESSTPIMLKTRQQLLEEGHSEENIERYLADHLPYEYVSSIVAVDIEALAKAAPQAPGKLMDDWAATLRQFNELQQAAAEKRQADAEEEVRQGKAVKLQLRWDERHQRWASWLKEDERTTVWAVDGRAAKDLGQGVYFCRIVKTPEHVQTPTLAFHIVQPFLKATRRLKHMRSDVSYNR